MSLKPLGKAFLFAFLAETIGGKFIERNAGALILLNQDLEYQAKLARWVKVVATGNLVEDFKVGDIVLVEALQWTTEFKFDEKKYWKSDATKVIAIADDESVTYTF
jgi:co-chaperonin GroES (HSP10)